MVFENSERWTFFFASTAPLACLIFDHLLCPECAAGIVENCRHRKQMCSCLGINTRSPLENAGMIGVDVVRQSGYGSRVGYKKFGAGG